MTQRRLVQHGIFHIVTNAQDREPWLTLDGILDMLIDNLKMTTNLHQAETIAFCILPDHMHIIVSPGDKGLSAFMHSFKRNSAKDIRKAGRMVRNAGNRTCVTGRDDNRTCITTSVRSADSAICDVSNRQPSRIAGNRTHDADGTRNRTHDALYIGWQPRFHDELIRDDEQLRRAQIYVTENAVKHDLVRDPEDWPWSSFHYDLNGWLPHRG